MNNKRDFLYLVTNSDGNKYLRILPGLKEHRLTVHCRYCELNTYFTNMCFTPFLLFVRWQIGGSKQNKLYIDSPRYQLLLNSINKITTYNISTVFILL